MFWWFTRLMKGIDTLERYANYLKERGHRKVEIRPWIIARSGATIWHSPAVEASVEGGKMSFREEVGQLSSIVFRADAGTEKAAKQNALEWKQFFEERQFEVQMLPLMREGP